MTHSIPTRRYSGRRSALTPSGRPGTSLPPQPLSPLDGRYRTAVAPLADYLSEAGLNRARVEVEVEWLIALTDRSLFGTRALTDDEKSRLRRSEEHTSELQSLMRISYAVFCLKKKKHNETK